MVENSSCAMDSLPGSNRGNKTSATWWYNEACLAICGSTGTWEGTKKIKALNSHKALMHSFSKVNINTGCDWKKGRKKEKAY